MSVLQRTIRIALSSLLANIVAIQIGLKNPFSAGIIAILAVLNTRKETFERAKDYFLSIVVAYAVANILFLWLGFSVYTYALFLSVFVPIAYYLKLETSISVCAVLVSHFIGASSISWQWQVNGLALLVVGLSFALIANYWIPSHTKRLEELIAQSDEKLILILSLFEEHLQEGESDPNRLKSEMKTLRRLLEEFETLALIDYENSHFPRPNKEYYIKYAQMRKRQHEVLKRIQGDLQNILISNKESKMLAALFKQTADQLYEKSPGIELLTQIGKLYREYRNSSLPKTRDEFESRAILYHVLKDYEKFLALKRDFYVKHGDKSWE